MAKATLEIVVSDKGGSGPAANTSAPAGAGQSVTAPPSVRNAPQASTTTTPANSPSTATQAAGAAATLADRAKIVQQVASASGAAGAEVAGVAGQVGTIARLGAVAGPVGVAIAAVGTAASLAAVTVKKFVDAMTDEARKLASVSSVVAVAVSQSELRQQLAEIRRGNMIGPQLAAFEDSRSRMMTKIYDLVSKIEGPLLEAVVPVLDAIGALVPYLEPIIKITFTIIQNTGDFNALRLILAAVKKYLGDDDKDKSPMMDPAVQKLLDLVDRGDGIVNVPGLQGI